MYKSIINDWKQSNYKILFISGDHNGCGKMYLAKQISKDFQYVDLSEIKNFKNDTYETYNVLSLLKCKNKNKNKLLIIDYNEYIKYKIPKKIFIIIILYETITTSLKNLIKKNYHIHIDRSTINYKQIIKKYNNNIKDHQINKLLLYFDYNINKILSHIKFNYDINKKKIDYFQDDSIILTKNIFDNKYSIDDILNITYDVNLISLHILDNLKKNNCNISFLLNYYQNIIYFDTISIIHKKYMKNYEIYLNILYPYLFCNKWIKNITYTKYISKNIIITHMLNINKYDIEDYKNKPIINKKLKNMYEKFLKNIL